MPNSRRPSTVAHTTNGATASSSRVHKSSDSHHGPINHPHSPLNSVTTPQQRMVQVLINRIKHKLPCNSGVALDLLEADAATEQAIEALVELAQDSLDIIAYALSELLDKLTKQTDMNGQLPLDVLQSQLFVLKVLFVAMSSRWGQLPRSSSRSSNRPPDASPASPYPASSHNYPSSSATAWSEPPPLDDNCAKWVLSVMVALFRQTMPTEQPPLSCIRAADITFNDFETVDTTPAPSYMDSPSQTPVPGPSSASTADFHSPKLRTQRSANSVKSSKMSTSSSAPVPSNSMPFEKTHMTLVRLPSSLSVLITKFAGRIIYHLSASNWTAVQHRLRTKIRFLASATDENADMTDLVLMAHCALDKTRLVNLLSELSSLLVNMKYPAQVQIALHLRTAIWNWIDVFPAEFNAVARGRIRMDGAPERVFDLLYSIEHNDSEKLVWPTLTALNCISPDRLNPNNTSSGQRSARKESRFVDVMIRHGMMRSKLTDMARLCNLDVCRAASYLQPGEDTELRNVAIDIAHEIKTILWKDDSQKSFWEMDQIDIPIYSEALVTVFRFTPQEDYIPLFKAVLEPERSTAVKICAVRAILTIMVEANRIPSQPPISAIVELLGPRLRSMFSACATRRNEVDQYKAIKRAAVRPKAKRTDDDTYSERDLLLLGVLALSRAALPLSLIESWGNTIEESLETWATATIKLWDGPFDNAVKVSAGILFRDLIESTFKLPADSPVADIMVPWMKLMLSSTLVSVVTNLLNARVDVEAQKLWMSVTHQVLELFVRRVDANHVRAVQFSSTRLSAFALAEIAFLVSLTSADITVAQLAGKGLRIIAQAERHPDAPAPTIIWEDLGKRQSVYEQLGDPSVMVVGRVGHQKRIRKLIKSIAQPVPQYIAVWEECYWRWRSLSEYLLEALPERLDDIQHHKNILSAGFKDKHFQWQNLTLFLAAFCGTCIRDGEDHPALQTIIPIESLPDEMRVLQNPATLVATFVPDLTNFLVADHIQIRDVARDALGSELSHRLYSRLLKNLDDTVTSITQAAGMELTDSYLLFLDQTIAVIKLLVESARLPTEEMLPIDISSLLLTLAQFMARFDSTGCARVKIKFCVLCDAICSSGADTLTLRKENGARHNILDTIMEWIQDVPTTAEPELGKVQKELNMAALRTAVKLLDRLQLRALDGSSGDDSVHVVSRLFIRYSGTLLRGLQTCHLDHFVPDNNSEVHSLQQKFRVVSRENELRELVITGLAHLVSANTESGFKQCLPLAYDKDLRKRTIFAHVFARVLGGGTTFDPKARAPVDLRQNRLCDLIRGSDMVLAMAICETCPATEVDLMVSVLLNVFDSRASIMALLKLMIDREIAHTENDAALFRGNSTCTRFLSAFARIHGYNYLRSLVSPLIKSMISIPQGRGYELDPAKVKDQDVEENQRNVELVASSFLDIISSSSVALPSMFREICTYIASSVNEIWPDSKFAALGAFMFLRFISPAVVAPEIIDIDLPKDDAIPLRRGLMVIAKIIQNLANNIFFGKEAHMVVLNKFLEDNIVRVTRYLSEINKYTPNPAEDAAEWTGTGYDDTDVIVLHRFFEKHADKIGKELLSLSKPSSEGDTSAISGKRAWDSLCALLVDLGPPPEVPRLSSSTSLEDTDYIDLMNRFGHRNTDAVNHLFVQTEVPADQPALFVLSLSKIDVEALDVELLMFHIFKTLAAPGNANREFEIILDCTSFTALSELPLQWVKYCAELVPVDIRTRFMVTYVLNANRLALKYLRRLYNVSGGLTFCGDVRACSSVCELLEYVPATVLTPLAYSINLEEEPSSEFIDVTMKQAHTMRMPAILQVGTTHLRITVIKPQTVSPSLNCRPTEIVSLSDVSDVYNVSTTGLDSNEFIVRRSRQGSTLYFSSMARDSIVKAIRIAKAHLKETNAPLAERFSRFSNVAATLLHVGMLSFDSDDDDLRSAAYDLLGSVCSYLKYDKSPIVASQAGFVAGDPGAFTIRLSTRIADYSPELTLDFISEVSTGLTGLNTAQKINCLQYMSPWIQNLSHFPNPHSLLYERSGSRLRDCVRTLTDLSVIDPEIAPSTQRCIWEEIAKLDCEVVNIVLDELIRVATDGSFSGHRCESIAQIISALSSINVRGRLISKLRKSLGKTPPKRCKSLSDAPHWNEVATLIRLSLVATAHHKPGTHLLYVPEIIHVVTLTAGTGVVLIRKSVYGMVFNLLQSAYLARTSDSTGPELLALINESTEPDVLKLFGLQRPNRTSDYTRLDTYNDCFTIEVQAALTDFLVRVMTAISGSTGLLNVWRARWTSLVTSTAFQLSPAVQTRAFIVLGTLAHSHVDDDFVYQMLVALQTGLAQSSEEDTSSVVSMLRCMCHIVPGLSTRSRYLAPLFWLAVALLQCSYVAFYTEATQLLKVTLETIESRGFFRKTVVSELLLEGRETLKETASQLDQLLGISFEQSFSFSLASVIFKGVRHSGLRDSAEAVLRTLLRVTVNSFDKEAEENLEYRGALCPDGLAYFIALLPFSTTFAAYRSLLRDSGIDGNWLSEEGGVEHEGSVPQVSLAYLGFDEANTPLFLASFVGAMLTSAQGDDAETQMLYTLLADLSVSFPEIISMVYDGLADKIKDVFANSSNAAIIRAASNVFRVSIQGIPPPPRSGGMRGSSSTLSTVDEVAQGPGSAHISALDEAGMQGLASSFQFLPPKTGHATTMIKWIPELVHIMATGCA